MQLYSISFKQTPKKYIGITKYTAAYRFKEHCMASKKSLISKAINKYGKENAIVTVIGEYDSFESLCAAEILHIKNIGTKVPNGYNLTDGGEGCNGYVMTQEHKDNIGKAHKGKIVSDATKKKLSDINKGNIVSKETREKISKANKGMKFSEETIQKRSKSLTGHKHTEASKKKMSESRKGVKNPLVSIANKNRVISDETRKKMSIASKKQVHSKERRAKASKTMKELRRNKYWASRGDLSNNLKEYDIMNTE